LGLLRRSPGSPSKVASEIVRVRSASTRSNVRNWPQPRFGQVSLQGDDHFALLAVVRSLCQLAQCLGQGRIDGGLQRHGVLARGWQRALPRTAWSRCLLHAGIVDDSLKGQQAELRNAATFSGSDAAIISMGWAACVPERSGFSKAPVSSRQAARAGPAPYDPRFRTVRKIR
jgi:hypothetical protein